MDQMCVSFRKRRLSANEWDDEDITKRTSLPSLCVASEFSFECVSFETTDNLSERICFEHDLCERNQYRQLLQKNFRKLKKNIDIVSTTAKLVESRLVPKEVVELFYTKRRSKKADLIMTKIIQTIEMKDIPKFEEIIGKSIADQIRIGNSRSFAIQDSDKKICSTTLDRFRTILLRTLQPDDIEDVKDFLLEMSIIDISENEDIIKHPGFVMRRSKEFVSFFVDNYIICKITSGSFQCLVDFLKEANNTRFSDIIYKLEAASTENTDNAESGSEITETFTVEQLMLRMKRINKETETDKEDKRRFVVVISAFVEVVMPVLRNRIESDFRIKNIGTFRDFLNSKPLLHTLFHLCFGEKRCCTDTTICISSKALSINKKQWDTLFEEKPSLCERHCHCKYTAKPIQLHDIGVTLAATILRNCCILSQVEMNSVESLREYKNTFFSHNTNGTLTEPDFQKIWSVIQNNIMKIDNSKIKDLVRIGRRTLDEPLSQKYYTHCMDGNTSPHEISQQRDKIESLSHE